MAIVIFLLVVAQMASGIYIWKLKKSETTDNDMAKTKMKIATNRILPNVQRPPLYHGNSIMESRFTTNTPLSMPSLVSASNLDLVRETTTSSMYNDHPAPWSNKPLKDSDKIVGKSPIGHFPPIDEHKPNALIMT